MRARGNEVNTRAKSSFSYWQILLMLINSFLFLLVVFKVVFKSEEVLAELKALKDVSPDPDGRLPFSIEGADSDEFGDVDLPLVTGAHSKRIAIGEFQVNTYTAGNQLNPRVISLQSGGFVATWVSVGQDGSMDGLFGQRFDAFGDKVGTWFQVNTFTDGQQDNQALTSFDGDSFLVTWQSGEESISPPDGNMSGVFAQYFNSTGGRIASEFQVNTYTIGAQGWPAITTLKDSSALIVWFDRSGEDGDSWGVFGQHLYANGTFIGSEFQVNNYTTSDQQFPSISALTDGGFVVVWGSYGQDGDSWGVFGQRFNATGNPVGSEFQVNTYTSLQQTAAAVEGLPAGGFVASWMSEGQDGGSFGVFAKQYDQMGVPIGPEFGVNTYTARQQNTPTIAALTEGGYLIVWESYLQDGSYYGIYGQRYDGMGVPVASEFRINTYTSYGQVSPSAASLSGGGVVVAWSSDTNAQQDGSGAGIFAQIYKPTIALVNSTVAITEGGVAVLTPLNLSAQDEYVAQLMLSFIISNLQHGQLLGVTGSMVPNSKIIASQVSILHDGGEIDLSFDVAACNGPYCSAPRAATVLFTHVDDPPVLSTAVAPTLTSILEDTANPAGDTVSSIIVDGSITDPDDPVVKAMAITAVDESIGRWDFSLNSGVSWAPVAPVSSANVLLLSGSDKVRLVPCANCNGQASFTFRAWGMKSGVAGAKVNPGNSTDFSVASDDALITVTAVNDPPVIVNSVISIKQGDSLILTSSMLSATDVDSDDATLEFKYSQLEHFRVDFVSSPDVSIDSNIQQDIYDGRIQLTHDGSAGKPGLDVRVSDGIDSSAVVSVTVHFTPTYGSINDRIIAGIVGGGIGLIFLALKIYLRFKAEQRLEKHAANKDGVQGERAEFRKNVLKPIAKAIAEEVKITGFLGHVGERTMRDFVSAVVELIAHLTGLGVDLDLVNMSAIDREQLLIEIARQTRYELGLSEKSCGMIVRFFKPEATPHQIETHAEQIAQAVDHKIQSRNHTSSVLSSGFLAPPSPPPQDPPVVVELSDIQVAEVANELAEVVMDHSESSSGDSNVISV